MIILSFLCNNISHVHIETGLNCSCNMIFPWNQRVVSICLLITLKMEVESNICDKSLATNQPYILWEWMPFSPGVADHCKVLKYYKMTVYPYCSHLTWFFFAISCSGNWAPSNCTAGLALETSHFDPNDQAGCTARQIHGFQHKNL